MTWADLNRQERVEAVRVQLARTPKAKETELADALGATRELVRHIIRYYGLERTPRRKGDDKPKPPPRAPRPEPQRRSTGLKFGNPISDVPTLPRDVDPEAFEPLPGATAKTLTELAPLRHDGSSAECHWPVGDGFCACATDGANRYCKTHTKRSGKMVPRLVFA